MKYFILIPAFLSLLIAGCETTPDDSGQGSAPVEGRGSEVTTVDTQGINRGNLPPELTDPRNILSQRSVYFDYDRFDIKPEYRELITAHAKFLVNNRQFRVLIQGNTDERGSREYNLALGQKRADAVKRMLVLLGAREDQVESVSLGEEKPKNPEQNELAWAENRRGDILYNGEF